MHHLDATKPKYFCSLNFDVPEVLQFTHTVVPQIAADDPASELTAFAATFVYQAFTKVKVRDLIWWENGP